MKLFTRLFRWFIVVILSGCILLSRIYDLLYFSVPKLEKIICEIIIASEPAKKHIRKFRLYCCTTNVNIPPTAIPNSDGIGLGSLHNEQ